MSGVWRCVSIGDGVGEGHRAAWRRAPLAASACTPPAGQQCILTTGTRPQRPTTAGGSCSRQGAGHRHRHRRHCEAPRPRLWRHRSRSQEQRHDPRPLWGPPSAPPRTREGGGGEATNTHEMPQERAQSSVRGPACMFGYTDAHASSVQSRRIAQWILLLIRDLHARPLATSSLWLRRGLRAGAARQGLEEGEALTIGRRRRQRRLPSGGARRRAERSRRTTERATEAQVRKDHTNRDVRCTASCKQKHRNG